MNWTVKVVVITSEEYEFEAAYNAALEQYDYSATVIVTVREEDGTISRIYPSISCDGNVYLHTGSTWMALQLSDNDQDASSLLNFVLEPPEKVPERIVRKQLEDYWLEVAFGEPDPKRIPEYARKIIHTHTDVDLPDSSGYVR